MADKKQRLDPDEARGRRFLKAIENRWSWRELTGEQIEQVLQMAEAIHEYMRQARKARTEAP